jgi:hypothetical protein
MSSLKGCPSNYWFFKVNLEKSQEIGAFPGQFSLKFPFLSENAQPKVAVWYEFF